MISVSVVNATARRNLLACAIQSGKHTIAPRFIDVANIHSQTDPAGNAVDALRKHLANARGGNTVDAIR